MIQHLDRNGLADEICTCKTPWEHMPFFLVTQTSLIEAEDEYQAAQKGIDQIRSGRQVTVAVKSDETSITHIAVAGTVDEPRLVSTSTAEAIDRSPVAIPEAAFARPTSRKHILKRMIADALTLVGRRT